jgi:hypothetical protein
MAEHASRERIAKVSIHEMNCVTAPFEQDVLVHGALLGSAQQGLSVPFPTASGIPLASHLASFPGNHLQPHVVKVARPMDKLAGRRAKHPPE